MLTEYNIDFPVEGYLGRASIRSTLRVYFMHHHVQGMLVVIEEGNQPLPLYNK